MQIESLENKLVELRNIISLCLLNGKLKHMNVEQLMHLSIKELEDLLLSVLPQQTIRKRQNYLSVNNTREEIEYVNNTSNTKIELIVPGGGYYNYWFYGQNNNGRFYILILSDSDQHKDYYFLDKPLDSNKVCYKKADLKN